MLEKVVVYVTQADQLLVFRHTEYPEAGFQVPAGTVKPGEALETAALRETVEETGLAAADFKLWARLGSDTIQTPPGGTAIRRHCYHFEFLGNTPETWIHAETDPSDGSSAPIEFELTWVTYPDEVPTLAGNQGAWLNRLKF